MCEPIISDNGIVHETPEGSGDLSDLQLYPRYWTVQMIFLNGLCSMEWVNEWIRLPRMTRHSQHNARKHLRLLKIFYTAHKSTLYENDTRQCVPCQFSSCNSCKAVFHTTCVFNTKSVHSLTTAFYHIVMHQWQACFSFHKIISAFIYCFTCIMCE